MALSERSTWPLPFVKYTGAGNDFILIDARSTPVPGEPSALARALCRRGHSVGADGLILLEEPGQDDTAGAVIRMRLWNADGSAAELSGNGARCVARWAVDEGLAVDEVVLATDVGAVRGHVAGSGTRLRLPMTATVKPNRRLRVEGRDLTGTYVEVGVPFFVCFHDDPDELAVRYLGRAIRNHPALAPRGANVDFVRVDDEQRLYFRVYERGVEAETLSSGTGSISAALAAAAAGKVHSPVSCVARGATLTVRYREAPAQPEGGDTAAPRPPEVGASDGTGAAGSARLSSGQVGDKGDESARADEVDPEVGRIVTDDGDRLHYVDLEVEGDAHRVFRAAALPEALE